MRRDALFPFYVSDLPPTSFSKYVYLLFSHFLLSLPLLVDAGAWQCMYLATWQHVSKQHLSHAAGFRVWILGFRV